MKMKKTMTMGWIVASTLLPAFAHAEPEPVETGTIKPPTIVEEETECKQEEMPPGEPQDPEEIPEAPDIRKTEPEPECQEKKPDTPQQEEPEPEEEEEPGNDPGGQQDNQQKTTKPQIVSGKKVPDQPQEKEREGEVGPEPIATAEIIDHFSSSPGSGGPLPKTATPYPTMAMIGGALTLAGAGGSMWMWGFGDTSISFLV
jgi:outer membrane biosynthesis protein TonB